jgi:hypothetical protein
MTLLFLEQRMSKSMAFQNPNYLPVYMKVNYLFNLSNSLFILVGRLFCKPAIQKMLVPSLFSPCSKERKYFMFGWTCEIEHKMYIPWMTLLFLEQRMSKSMAFQCKTLNIEPVNDPGNTFALNPKWTRTLPLAIESLTEDRMYNKKGNISYPLALCLRFFS